MGVLAIVDDRTLDVLQWIRLNSGPVGVDVDSTGAMLVVTLQNYDLVIFR
ncbi:MAG: hypothetical protein ABI877_22390 [Gemmatimonadaceae bacterium]